MEYVQTVVFLKKMVMDGACTCEAADETSVESLGSAQRTVNWLPSTLKFGDVRFFLA
jgi:hypothetical protein